MIERVRAVLVTPDRALLTIRRDRPGTPTYRVLPGGHVEPADTSLEAALSREIREELAGDPQIHSLLYVLDSDTDRQYFYLATIDRWAFDKRTGPEFDEAGRGGYALDVIQFAAATIAVSNLKPDAVAAFLEAALVGGDPFTLPDQRTSNGHAPTRVALNNPPDLPPSPPNANDSR